MGALSQFPANFKAGAVQLAMDINRGSVEDIDVARARRAWESATRYVTKCYAELERAIEHAEAKEHAFNLAQRAAKLRNSDVGAAVLAVAGGLAGLVS